MNLKRENADYNRKRRFLFFWIF